MRRWPTEGDHLFVYKEITPISKHSSNMPKKQICVTIARAMTEVLDEGADSFRVTIILVPKDEASLSKKLKRTPQSESVADEDKMVTMERSRLRKCSNYFATCMSGRWATDMVFHLELQTQPRYYHDCFARMKSPFLEPIPSITHGIELFKVASQIEYHALMDTCEKFLAAAPWSTAEKDELYSWCVVGELPCDSDLVVRLFPLSRKARQIETQSLIQRRLKWYLDIAMHPDFSDRKQLPARKMFSDTFHALCEESSGEMAHDALIHALDAIKMELGKILITWASLGIGWPDGGWPDSHAMMTRGMLRFCWMFQLLRDANAAQILVELLLEHNIHDLLESTLDLTINTCPSLAEAAHQWAKMIYFICQDLLSGRLFMTYEERMAFSLNWIWAFEKIDHLSPGEPPVFELVVAFAMSFPQPSQERFFFRWEHRFPSKDPNQFPDAHKLWIKSMLRADHNVPNLEGTSNATVDANEIELPN